MATTVAIGDMVRVKREPLRYRGDNEWDLATGGSPVCVAGDVGAVVGLSRDEVRVAIARTGIPTWVAPTYLAPCPETTIDGLNGPLKATDIGVPGLLVVETESVDGLALYSVTHVDSKACVAFFDDAATAMRAACELGSLTDWTASASQIKATADARTISDTWRRLGGSNLCANGSYTGS